ncbi:MAG: DUF6044 family protein [Ectobacillus sp.]
MLLIKRSQEQKAIYTALFLITLYVLPLYVLGEDAHIRVHDNMDSNIAWYKVLRDSGELFGDIDASIKQVINGLPRNAYGTEFSLLVWLHYWLPSMTAYAISQTIVRLFAFLGMYLLLKDFFIREPNAYWIRAGAALTFALTPFWPSGMLSTLGHPLALWAFLHIRRHTDSAKHWLTIMLLPLYSSFVLGFFFFLAAMGMLWLADLVRQRRLNLPFAGSIVLMLSIYMLIDYRFVHSLLFSSEPTSRNEFVSSRLALPRTIRLIFKNFALGHNHVMTVHTIVILPVQLFVLALLIYKKKWRQGRIYFLLFLLNFLLSAWYAFWFYKGWQPLKERFSVLNTFNFARFHFLRPTIIYVLFALALYILWQQGSKWQQAIKAIIIAQIIVLLTFNEEVHYRYVGAPSFKQFYATSLFDEIDSYIGKPKDSYRVVSIGFHPAIAQYNGFYTLDTYNNFYPLSYKHSFRVIIEKELQKNKQLRTYFDTWGGRCYIFTDELGKWYDFRKTSRKTINHLQLNSDMLYQMGGRYIFSAVPITNAADNGLKLLRTFEHRDTVWKVYLYEVNKQGG